MIDLDDPDPIQTLAESLGETWPAILEAKQACQTQLVRLRTLVAATKPPANTAVTAYGSLARGEWTAMSDLDWTFLIDGPSDISHFDASENLRFAFEQANYASPGATQTFGTMTSSHPLVHCIGGPEDTNQNMTRRLLLLLESTSLDSGATQERVIRAILERYIMGDPPASQVLSFRVPLFLLNDVVRLWRTFTVDYAAKKWQRTNKGWAIRNVKLRMSRKLLFVKGLLICFACHPSFAGQIKEHDADAIDLELLTRCFVLSRLPAMAVLASALHALADKSLAIRIVTAYDQFLRLLNDEERRTHLEKLPFGQSTDPVFEEQRQISREFREGLIQFFFESNEQLTQLVKRYGIF